MPFTKGCAASRWRKGVLEGGAAMSFEEIGRKLGVTKEAVWIAYKRGIRKLRESPEARRLLASTRDARS